MGFKSFVDFFARPWRKQRPNRRKAKPDRTARLLVEMLERRDLLAAPSIVAAGVLPLDGSTVSSGSPTIRVQFSEPMTASVLTPSNYVLLGSSGNT
ncbi:MAG: hypothetical protein HY289_02990, partial [Planctomycetes bacterium]|nr:hypothetical protein [Planctomycetota bacterium]